MALKSRSNRCCSSSSSIGNATSTDNRRRRSRSLSRGAASRSIEQQQESGTSNNTRERGRFASSATQTQTQTQTQRPRRARSVSRPPPPTPHITLVTAARTRRSASLARYHHHFTDDDDDDDDDDDVSEETEDHSHKPSHHANIKSFSSWNHRKSSLHNPATPTHQRVLKRSPSQKELSKSCNGYSSHSSALTDEEARDTPNKSGNERTIRAVYSHKKTEHPTGDGVATELCEVMRRELRLAVEDIRMEIEHGIINVNHPDLTNDDSLELNNSDCSEAVSLIRRNYTAQLEQSEKRKQDLLAEIVAEEQRGRDLSKIVKHLLPNPKSISIQEKSSLGRKRNDKSWTSKCLIEDAEKYFDDFLSSVEDTDISSFDGERSDASSTIGAKRPKDQVLRIGERGNAFSTRSSLPVEMDGVMLPWLQWETSNDGSPPLCKSNLDVRLDLEDTSCLAQGNKVTYNEDNFSTESYASSSLGGSQSLFLRDATGNRFGDSENLLDQSPAKGPTKSYLGIDEDLHFVQSEDILFETWRQQHGINSGSLTLCSRSFLHF